VPGRFARHPLVSSDRGAILHETVTIPPSPSQPPASRADPLTGSDWLAARASIASRRVRRFTRTWTLVLGPLVAAAFIIPLASAPPTASGRDAARLVDDTVRTAERVASTALAAMVAESLYTAASLENAEAKPPMEARRPAVVATAPAAAANAAPAAANENPAVLSLANAISEARRLRTPTAWLAVAKEPPVNGGPRMRALADSLASLAQRRDALPSGPEREQQAAPLTAAISRVGYTILAIAENRRATLAEATGSAAASVAVAPEVEIPAALAASVPTPVTVRADTAELAANVAAARGTLGSAQRGHARAVAALESFRNEAPTAGRASLLALSPALALLGLLITGLAVRFAIALQQERDEPTLASAIEAERAIGATVLATVKDAPLDGPARFRPSGVDPFRMLYLGLTATGTRARTMIVTGSDPVIVAAVGARLAISAAADHRATLVVDLDPAGIALSRTFRERPEPGLTDALAGSFRWREIARPVGSSDGLPITLMPAGTERDDLPVGDALAAQREDLTRFRSAFDFTILVAPAPNLAMAIELVESSPLVLCAVVGETKVADFTATGASLRSGARRLHGVVLWDAPRPQLPTRAELAAMLSTRKGRTPGGSFAAVQKVIESYKRQ